MKNASATTLLDWITEPSSVDKKTNCGKLTQVTIFTNGTISVKPFYCHRYDCQKCGVERKKEIKGKILKVREYWFVMPTNEDDFGAIRKRIKRQGEQYCVIGSGNRLLLMTLKPVMPESKAVMGDKLGNMINEYLDCGYDYRKRRFRHSSGLFPTNPKSDPITHIKRKYAVNQAKDGVIKELEAGGYFLVHHGFGKESEDYLRPSGNITDGDKAVCGVADRIVWAEGGTNSHDYDDEN